MWQEKPCCKCVQGRKGSWKDSPALIITTWIAVFLYHVASSCLSNELFWEKWKTCRFFFILQELVYCLQIQNMQFVALYGDIYFKALYIPHLHIVQVSSSLWICTIFPKLKPLKLASPSYDWISLSTHFVLY